MRKNEGKLTHKRLLEVLAYDHHGWDGGKQYKASHIAFAHFYGRWPEKDVDHRNHDRIDNRIENLREATDSQNNANQRVSKRNKTGVKGIHRPKGRESFDVTCNGKWIGTFKDFGEAIAARLEAEKLYQREFAYNACHPGESPRLGSLANEFSAAPCSYIRGIA